MMYILSNWTILEGRKPGGEVVMRLRGEVFGNPRYLAGGEVTISALHSCRQDGDAISVITRSGSEYVLGNPNPAEPEATTRVLQHLQAQSAVRTGTGAGREA
jgi:hypothetical protein